MKTSKHPRLIVLTVLMLVVSLLLAACGGGGKPADTTAAAKPAETTAAGKPGGETKTETPPAADAWKPTKGITLVVPYAAGGSSDLLARAVEKVWSKYCDQPIKVEVKTGGGGVIGNNAVATSTPDGHTMTAAFGSGSETVMPYIQPSEYKPFEILRPVCRLSYYSVGIIVKDDSPYQTLEDLIKDAKAKGKLTCAVTTAAGSADFVARGLGQIADIDVVPIPHTGGAAAMTTLMGGSVDFGAAHPSDIVQHLVNKKLRVLAVATPDRDPTLPDVPTLKEEGYDFYTWGSIKGVAMPIKTPDNIVAFYEDLFKKISQDEEFIKTCQDNNIPVLYLNEKDFKANLEEAVADYKRLSDELGIKEAVEAESGKK